MKTENQEKELRDFVRQWEHVSKRMTYTSGSTTMLSQAGRITRYGLQWKHGAMRALFYSDDNKQVTNKGPWRGYDTEHWKTQVYCDLGYFGDQNSK